LKSEIRNPKSEFGSGFTLIELLIVVAIIAILAAIAIPNFLAAQTRSKVSRAKGEMRTIATALESYCVDYNQYPPSDNNYKVTPTTLTTPISYLRSHRIPDPFALEVMDQYGSAGGEELYYTYWNNDWNVAVEGGATSVYWGGIRKQHGKWSQNSIGPDRNYYNSPVTGGTDNLVQYDPTNGTISYGNIWRTQLHTDGYQYNSSILP
jgi:type II secretion system protein G